MSLKSKFKSSSALVHEGVWFDVCTNADGTKCRVKLRRHGRTNRLWTAAFRKHTADKDMENITPEEDEAITANVFVEACLVDWEHLQLEDDGTETAFSIENALELLTNPDWNDLLKDWQTKANTMASYQAAGDKKREDEAGN